MPSRKDKQPNLLYALIAIVSAAYGFTIFMTSHPNTVSHAVGSTPVKFDMVAERTLRGWFSPESWGTWANGNASIHLDLKKVPKSGALDLAIDTQMMLGPKVPNRTLTVFINDKSYGDFPYGPGNPAQVLKITVPESDVPDDGQMDIRFVVNPIVSPVEAGLNPDIRPLGIGLMQIAVTPSP